MSGRLVDTAFREVDNTHAVIDISDFANINHLVVFLTGQTPFPEGTGGAVYFSRPEANAPANQPWQYLGMISNQKPSAIFKVAKLKSQQSDEQSMTNKFQMQMQQNQPAPVSKFAILNL